MTLTAHSQDGRPVLAISKAGIEERRALLFDASFNTVFDLQLLKKKLELVEHIPRALCSVVLQHSEHAQSHQHKGEAPGKHPIHGHHTRIRCEEQQLPYYTATHARI